MFQFLVYSERTEAYYFRGKPVICPVVVCPGGVFNFPGTPGYNLGSCAFFMNRFYLAHATVVHFYLQTHMIQIMKKYVEN